MAHWGASILTLLGKFFLLTIGLQVFKGLKFGGSFSENLKIVIFSEIKIRSIGHFEFYFSEYKIFKIRSENFRKTEKMILDFLIAF